MQIKQQSRLAGKTPSVYDPEVAGPCSVIRVIGQHFTKRTNIEIDWSVNCIRKNRVAILTNTELVYKV